jgi:hypothetical protein
LSRNESGRFGALKSDSTHHFFRNAVACFSDVDDVSGNQNNCYWPLHSESRDVNTIYRRSWYIAAHIWKIYDFKIDQGY